MAHAPFAPSSAHRWFNCPGSVRESAGIPSRSSPDAERGTFGHAVAARVLADGHGLESVLGTRRGDHVVDNELLGAVRVYVDAVRGQLMIDGGRLYVEERVTLDPALCWGTGDAFLLSADGTTLHVFDLKLGRGVFVDVDENPQLLIYASAFLQRPEARAVQRVETHIVQPLHHGDAPPWRSAVYDRPTVERFGLRASVAIAKAQAPDAPLAPGDWCRFCPAKTKCPALRALAVQSAEHVFAEPPAPTPDVRALTAEEVGKLLPLFDRAEAWIEAVREHAADLARREKVPGYKLVAKVGNRRWLDETAAAAALRAAGVDPMEKPAIVSPAAAEKLLGKSRAKLVAEHVIRPTTGTTLVPESDKRPALPAGVPFDTIPEDPKPEP